MSSSDAPGAPTQPTEQEHWGTVFMGPDSTRESRMDKLLGKQQRELWNQSTELEYLRRVREKATAEAVSILDKARGDGEELRRQAGVWAAELKAQTEENANATYARARQEVAMAESLRLEAERLRNQAQAEGWKAGFEAAHQEGMEREAVRDEAAAAVLHRIREQCDAVFTAWREELVVLTRQAVQTAIGWIVREDRAHGLQELLERSVHAMENRQVFTVHVSPEDADVAREMLGKAQENLGLGRWTVLENPDVEAGGLLLESDISRVENYPAMRRAVVEEVLARLALPPDEAERAVMDVPFPELSKLPDPDARAAVRAKLAAMAAAQAPSPPSFPADGAAGVPGAEPAPWGGTQAPVPPPDAQYAAMQASGLQAGPNPYGFPVEPAQAASPVPPLYQQTYAAPPPPPPPPVQPAPPPPPPVMPPAMPPVQQAAPTPPPPPPPAPPPPPVQQPAPPPVQQAAPPAPPPPVQQAAPVPDPVPEAAPATGPSEPEQAAAPVEPAASPAPEKQEAAPPPPADQTDDKADSKAAADSARDASRILKETEKKKASDDTADAFASLNSSFGDSGGLSGLQEFKF